MSSELSSFDDFFRCHFERVVGFLMKMGFDFDEARDAAAEAMLQAYKAWATISQPRPWIYKVAQRIAVKSALRDQDGAKRATLASVEVPRHIDPCTVVDDYGEILTVLSGLPKAQRSVITWRLHDFTPMEIAEQLGMNEATVRSHLRHARARLRKYFEAAK